MVVWGAHQDVGGCKSQEMRIGDHHFLALGYGASVRLSDNAQRRMGYGDDYELNQCVLIAIAAGIEWISHGKPRR